MSDVYGTFALLLLVSAMLFLIGLRLATARRAGLISTLLALAALIAWVLLAADNLALTRILPVTSVLVVADSTLPLVALFVGLLVPQLTGARRILYGAVLLIAGALQSLWPVLGEPPVTQASSPINGVIHQTSDATCGAASAATLLLANGIPATEPEMTHLCLTRSAGTSDLGIYRGLREKTAGTSSRIIVLSRASVEDLRRVCEIGKPVLISVGLNRWSYPPVDPRYERDWGWTPGRRHAVVVFRFLPGDRVDVGDPSAGREAWDVTALSVLWHGEGLYLTPRNL